jgi:hypothetical protein
VPHAHQVAEAKGCRDLRNMPGSKVELSGTLVYHKITYLVSCCHTASPPVLLSVSARAASRACPPQPDLLSAGRRDQSTPANPSTRRHLALQIRCLRGAERCTIRYAPHSGPAKKRPVPKKGRRLEANDTGKSARLQHVVPYVLQHRTLNGSGHPIDMLPCV